MSNYEIWYGRFSEFAFYEAKIDGMISAIEDMVRNKGVNYFWLFEKFKKGEDAGFGKLTAIDYDILNFKLAFGAKGIYFGGQWKVTRLGFFNEGANTNTTTGDDLVGFGYSEDNYSSVGFGVHANVSIKNLTAQNHLMLNWVKSKDGFFLKEKSLNLKV